MKAMKARQESTGDDNKMRKWANKNNITLGKLAIAAPMKAMRAKAPRGPREFRAKMPEA